MRAKLYEKQFDKEVEEHLVNTRYKEEDGHK